MDTFIINSVEDIDTVAKQFIENYKNHKIVAFYGEMGAGKTTFIKSLCKAMNVEDDVNSPSFAIVNEYRTTSGETIFHFDFYRLKNVDEAIDMGYEEYIYSGNYCFMEWPEKIEPVLPDERLDVFIEENPNGSRTVKVMEYQNK
ncbi:MAG: tRNA (adenosine(37)-N6)-threonylcarbamoyltransferase complex ATPase subunit type 1 TsaE [Chlorobi bacterium]|nr:tRNA (adenosine(37)-N6)-threonylcarbamoyltransferase complex ATPase subunit type 1 TsaE [Chlorobiota bacterium]